MLRGRTAPGVCRASPPAPRATRARRRRRRRRRRHAQLDGRAVSEGVTHRRPHIGGRGEPPRGLRRARQPERAAQRLPRRHAAAVQPRAVAVGERKFVRCGPHARPPQQSSLRKAKVRQRLRQTRRRRARRRRVGHAETTMRPAVARRTSSRTGLSGVDCSAHGAQRAAQIDVGPSPPALSERAFATVAGAAPGPTARGRALESSAGRPLGRTSTATSRSGARRWRSSNSRGARNLAAGAAALSQTPSPPTVRRTSSKPGSGSSPRSAKMSEAISERRLGERAPNGEENLAEDVAVVERGALAVGRVLEQRVAGGHSSPLSTTAASSITGRPARRGGRRAARLSGPARRRRRRTH